MDNTAVKKGILELKGNEIMIFGVTGFLDEGDWIVYDPNVEVFCEIDKDSPFRDITEIINSDISAGDFDKIAYIRILPSTAVRLFLEKKITPQMVFDAIVEEGKITFSPICFHTSLGDKTFQVIVTPEFDYYMATVDSEGNVV